MVAATWAVSALATIFTSQATAKATLKKGFEADLADNSTGGGAARLRVRMAVGSPGFAVAGRPSRARPARAAFTRSLAFFASASALIACTNVAALHCRAGRCEREGTMTNRQAQRDAQRDRRRQERQQARRELRQSRPAAVLPTATKSAEEPPPREVGEEDPPTAHAGASLGRLIGSVLWPCRTRCTAGSSQPCRAASMATSKASSYPYCAGFSPHASSLAAQSTRSCLVSSALSRASAQTLPTSPMIAPCGTDSLMRSRS